MRRCREYGLFLRDEARMGTPLGGHAVRVAVKDIATHQKMLETLERVTAER